MKNSVFIFYNFIYLMSAFFYKCYLIPNKNVLYINTINVKIYRNVYSESFLAYSKDIFNSLKRKKKNHNDTQIHLVKESKLKKLDEKEKTNKKKEEVNTQNKDQNINSIKKKKKKKSKREKKIEKDQYKSLLSYIKKNEIKKDNNISDDLKDEHFYFLKYFKLQDNSLTSELNPEQSKEIINSNNFKKLMIELNLKEDEILRMLNKSEKDVSHLINKNLTIEEIEKKAKNEDLQNEKLFGTFMDNNNSKIGNLINFKKIGKKYKDVIREVIILFLNKKKNFIVMMNNIENDNEIKNYICVLKENILFKDFNDEILTEIAKKSILIGYLNQKFSNDNKNFEWNRNLEKCISLSINNNNFKVKEIIYYNNSININIESMKRTDIDSSEYDEIENYIRNSIEAYEKMNDLDILSYFNILISIN
ncbi:conserved Plasmodium protein, unknown function [Plasmodium relictum]|uniref:Uncharacterized protein n=1 Tax=Plasmodium relictum TaxID=85471 RepID=A0A1J1HDN9_PLARL|nr:conserved Plasmodium protein, unknown function [Plasmodium relictum]CRH04019.1 conserved Plasmodium protein, unknown function [Plasmodium relictum]